MIRSKFPMFSNATRKGNPRFIMPMHVREDLISLRNDNHIIPIDVLEFKGCNRNKILIHICVLLKSVICMCLFNLA